MSRVRDLFNTVLYSRCGKSDIRDESELLFIYFAKNQRTPFKISLTYGKDAIIR